MCFKIKLNKCSNALEKHFKNPDVFIECQNNIDYLYKKLKIMVSTEYVNL